MDFFVQVLNRCKFIRNTKDVCTIYDLKKAISLRFLIDVDSIEVTLNGSVYSDETKIIEVLRMFNGNQTIYAAFPGDSYPRSQSVEVLFDHNGKSSHRMLSRSHTPEFFARAEDLYLNRLETNSHENRAFSRQNSSSHSSLTKEHKAIPTVLPKMPNSPSNDPLPYPF